MCQREFHWFAYPGRAIWNQHSCKRLDDENFGITTMIFIAHVSWTFRVTYGRERALGGIWLWQGQNWWVDLLQKSPSFQLLLPRSSPQRLSLTGHPAKTHEKCPPKWAENPRNGAGFSRQHRSGSFLITSLHKNRSPN